MPMPRVGDFSTYLIHQEMSQTADGLGGMTETWSVGTGIWGLIEPASAAVLERRFGGTVESPAHWLVTIRRRTDVTIKGRLLWGTRTLLIRGLQDRGSRWPYLLCVCEEVV